MAFRGVWGLGRASQGPRVWPPTPDPNPALQIPQRFLMGPGPGNSDPRVLATQSLPLLGHM